jgi:hypothetical protein
MLRTFIWATAVCLTFAGLTAPILYQRGWYSAPPTTAEEIQQRRQENKVAVTEAHITCLGQEMWHGANKGRGTKEEHIRIGYTALNFAKQTGKDLCTIFTDGLIMLPASILKKHRDAKGDGDSSPYTRWSGYVSLESAFGSRRSTTYKNALEWARQLTAQEKDVMIFAPKDACWTKYVRAYDGSIDSAVEGGRAALRREMVAELGEPIFKETSGAEFFCPKLR